MAKTTKPAAAINAVDKYIAEAPEALREGLTRLREIIRAAAPDAEETVSYGVPLYKLNGMLVGFGAAKKHYGLYPGGTSMIKLFAAELEKYDTSPGTIRFPVGKPLPVTLIKKIIKAKMKENAEKAKTKAAAKVKKK